MKKAGNGLPETCVDNLVRIRRGEVAFERVKGIDVSLVDQPTSEILEDASSDAERQIEIFEPRVDVDNVKCTGEESVGGGNFNFDISIHRKETSDVE